MTVGVMTVDGGSDATAMADGRSGARTMSETGGGGDRGGGIGTADTKAPRAEKESGAVKMSLTS